MPSVFRTIASDFEISVDVRDAAGRGRRLKTTVVCEVPVVADMPVVAAATKPNGWSCTWMARSGTVMRPLPEVVRDRAGLKRRVAPAEQDAELRRQTLHLTAIDLDCRRSDRHALTGEIVYDASNGEVVPWADEAAWRGCDLSAARMQVEELRRDVPRLLAVQDGILHLASDLPSWWVDPDRAVVQLTVPHGVVRTRRDYRHAGGHHLVWTYSADRLDDALAYQRRRRPDVGIDVRGSIEFLNPAHAPGTNLPDLAGVVCTWLVETVRYPLAELPADLVRRWHDVAAAANAGCNDGPRRAAEILVAVAALAEDLQAYPDAFTGRGSSLRSNPFWNGVLQRLEVEGVRAPPPERRAAHAVGG